MKKKLLPEEFMPEFDAGITDMKEDSKIFVDKSLEIADYIFRIMEQRGLKQKDLAERMGKTEAEISKFLGGMHNYTLRSISKIEAALGMTVICTPLNRKMIFPRIESRKLQYEKTERKLEMSVCFSAMSGKGRIVEMKHVNYSNLSSNAI